MTTSERSRRRRSRGGRQQKIRRVKLRAKTLFCAIQSAYDAGQIEFLDRCILVNEVEHLRFKEIAAINV